MLKKSLLFLFPVLWLLMSIQASAQTYGCNEAQHRVVSFLTCSQGGEIYELEGHSALRIIDHDKDIDYVVNWGIFDFTAPNFVYRFVKGETDYMSGASPTQWFLRQYERQGRIVTEQILDLTEAETDRLVNLIEECLRPENRVYRYNYVYDNCSTRALSFIENALGDTLSLSAPEIAPGINTFRKVMSHYHVNYPWYQFGIDLALGSGIDRQLTRRELAFAPVLLMEMLDGATRQSSGHPIVNDTRQLTVSSQNPVAGPTPWFMTPMSVACVVLALSITLTVYDIHRHRVTRWFDTLLYGVFGIMGCVIFFLVFISIHEATTPNWIILWLNPLCFIPAVTVWVKKAENLLLWYHFLNFATLIVLMNIFLFGIQGANNAFYPLIIADLLRSLAYICVIKWSKRLH